MSRAGQASEVGSVFRCAAANHIVIHGLRGQAVAGLDLPAGVDAVRIDFETADPTDDVGLTFSDGRRAYVSAKRELGVDAEFRSTVAGWIHQVPDLGPDDLLVLAAEKLQGKLAHLGPALKAYRAGRADEDARQRQALAALRDLLPDGIADEVFSRARVIEVAGSTDRGLGRSLLVSLAGTSWRATTVRPPSRFYRIFSTPRPVQRLGAESTSGSRRSQTLGLTSFAALRARRALGQLPEGTRWRPTAKRWWLSAGGSISRSWLTTSHR